MLEYKSSYFNLVVPLMRHAIANRCGRDLARSCARGARPIYRELLTKAPDVGRNNPMEHNIYMAIALFSMQLASGGRLSVADFTACAQDMMELPVMRLMGVGRAATSTTPARWRNTTRPSVKTNSGASTIWTRSTAAGSITSTTGTGTGSSTTTPAAPSTTSAAQTDCWTSCPPCARSTTRCVASSTACSAASTRWPRAVPAATFGSWATRWRTRGR